MISVYFALGMVIGALMYALFIKIFELVGDETNDEDENVHQ